MQLNFLESGRQVLKIVVYAKCDAQKRFNFWDDIYYVYLNNRLPCLIGGDFNFILSDYEKIAGLPMYPQEYKDFAYCINSCDLIEFNFKGSLFTWWNGRADSKCIFKKLDMFLINQSFLGLGEDV